MRYDGRHGDTYRSKSGARRDVRLHGRDERVDVFECDLGAGVPDDVIAASVGVIARGVNDIWTNTSGVAKYSPYFYDRVTQLVMRAGGRK